MKIKNIPLLNNFISDETPYHFIIINSTIKLIIHLLIELIINNNSAHFDMRNLLILGHLIQLTLEQLA